MSDVMTPEQRSRAMSHIKGKDTSIEVLLRKALWHKGIRYRKNYKKATWHPGYSDNQIQDCYLFATASSSTAIIGRSKNKSWGTTGNIGSEKLSAIWPVTVKMILS